MLRMIAAGALPGRKPLSAPSGGPFPAHSPFRPWERGRWNRDFQPMPATFNECQCKSSRAPRRARTRHMKKAGPGAAFPFVRIQGLRCPEARSKSPRTKLARYASSRGSAHRWQHSWPQVSSSRPFRRAPSERNKPSSPVRMVRRHVLDRERLVSEAISINRGGMPFGGGQVYETAFAQTNTLLP